MHNYDRDNTQQVGLNANDFLGGKYLKKEDLDGPTNVRIVEVWQEAIRGERLLLVQFEEFEKPLILNKTNIRVLIRTFETTNVHRWRGEVELYVERNVEYSGRVVGGIRVRPLPAREPSRPEGERQLANGRQELNGHREPDGEYGF